MNLENLDEEQIKDLNKTITKAAQALFEAMYGEFSKDELKFISDVLEGVKERSGGSMHVSFDHRELINSKDRGKSVDDILNMVFSLPDTKPGEGGPYEDNVERFSYENMDDFISKLKAKGKPYVDEFGDESFKFNDSQKMTEIERLDKSPKYTDLPQQVEKVSPDADAIICKHLAKAGSEEKDNLLEHLEKNSKPWKGDY